MLRPMISMAMKPVISEMMPGMPRWIGPSCSSPMRPKSFE